MRAKGLKVETRVLQQACARRPGLCAMRSRRQNGESGLSSGWRWSRMSPRPLYVAPLAARVPGSAVEARSSRILYRALEDEFGVVPRRAALTVEVGRCTQLSPACSRFQRARRFWFPPVPRTALMTRRSSISRPSTGPTGSAFVWIPVGYHEVSSRKSSAEGAAATRSDGPVKARPWVAHSPFPEDPREAD